MSDGPVGEERVVIYDPLIALMARFENVKVSDSSVDAFAGLSVEGRLKKHIVDGIKKNLERDLDDALEIHAPLAIINEILLDGMKTVGELFGAGKMQLPFVLQSAEVMKASVKFLEPKMEKVEGSEKGSMLIATVQGDVHDIGKNLVDIILSNNGYRVVNIGIKQPINSILEKALEHKCQVIGMSGLLVKSTLIMRDNLIEMNERGLSHIPVILGGAALTRGYVEQDLRAVYQGSVYYAQDAFEGLRLMGELSAAPRTGAETAAEAALQTEVANRSEPLSGGEGSSDGTSHPSTTVRSIASGEDFLAVPGVAGQEYLEEQLVASGDAEQVEAPRVSSHRVGDIDQELYFFTGVKSDVVPVAEPPKLPFYGARKQTRFDIFEIYKYVNPIALYRGQWQFRRPEEMSNPEFAKWLCETADPIFARLKRELATVLKPRVKWGYFPCAGEGNDLVIYREDSKTERMRFTFPRQRDLRRQCLADFFQPVGSGIVDVVGFHIVTVGSEVSKRERELFAAGEFQDYLYTHGMGVETAEALAEYWHRQIRHELGIADQEPADMRLLFSARYHGARYSFGYPACPNLEDQAKLFELLEPRDIGLELSEEFMLVPEQSTSAIIVHHPEAKYFNIR